MGNGVFLDVRPDLRELNRAQAEISKKITPRVTSRAINETTAAAKNVGVKTVSKEIKVPLKFLTTRFDKNGQKKGNRVVVVKATSAKLLAILSIYVRGLPAIQLVTAAQRVRSITGRAKQGVKATGGRTYRRGFVAEGPAGSGNVQLFARLGKKRKPVGVIKVGVRKRLTRRYDDEIQRNSPKVFRARWNRLMQYELDKL